jgi:sec-independent protein translocase protein TatC
LLGRGDGDEEIGPHEKKMGFLDHLEELRYCIIKSLVALLVGMMVVGGFFPWFFSILQYPLVRGTGEADAATHLVNFSVLGVFTVMFDVLVFGGVALALPAIAYFVTRFVAPGLTTRERGLLRPALVAATLLFIMGSLFSYFLLLPMTIRAAKSLNAAFHTVMYPLDAPKYYEMVAWGTLGAGVVFEFPLVLVALMTLGVVSADFLRKYRKHTIVGLLILAAFISPSPDILTFLTTFTPLYVLFEVSLLVGDRMRRKRVAAQAVAEAEEAANEAREAEQERAQRARRAPPADGEGS